MPGTLSRRAGNIPHTRPSMKQWWHHRNKGSLPVRE